MVYCLQMGIVIDVEFIFCFFRNPFIHSLPSFRSNSLNALVQKLANVFCKRLDCTYFRLCEPYVLCHNFSTLPLNHKSSYKQYRNK